MRKHKKIWRFRQVHYFTLSQEQRRNTPTLRWQNGHDVLISFARFSKFLKGKYVWHERPIKKPLTFYKANILTDFRCTCTTYCILKTSLHLNSWRINTAWSRNILLLRSPSNTVFLSSHFLSNYRLDHR